MPRKRRRKGKLARQQILRRLAQERFQRRIRRKQWARERRALARGNVPTKLSKRTTLRAPEVFELYQLGHRKAVITFLRALRDIVGQRKSGVIIDFAYTRKMVACGTLLFLAEARRLIQMPGTGRIKCVRIRDDKVAQVLQRIGFFETIGKKSRVAEIAEDVIHWRHLAGRGAEGEKANTLVEAVGERLPKALTSTMYNGLVEAMTNSTQHAYIRLRKDGLSAESAGQRGEEWWMFAKEQDGKVTVVLCDLGIGIPNSLPITQGNRVVELVAQAGRASGMVFADSDLIRAALEIGKSRTGEIHRGKGLRDVVEVVDAAQSGTLQIYSNHGRYTHRYVDGRKIEETVDYGNSILGTLISWEVPIDQAREVEV